MTAVLDASALVALLRAEPGAEVVESLLDVAVVSAVNWSEVRQKLAQHGGDPNDADYLLILGVAIEPFTANDAKRTADLFVHTRHAGLSLADRACLALAQRLGAPAVTADRAWAEVDIGVQVDLVR